MHSMLEIEQWIRFPIFIIAFVCFSASSHFLKVELPEYLEHEPETSQTKQAISIADQSSESLAKYKQLEDDNEIDIIYQDSESEQRDASEMGKMMRFSSVSEYLTECFISNSRTAVHNTGIDRWNTRNTWWSARYVNFVFNMHR